ncbi:hypothetical protein QN402_26975, partial [Pseudomonas sp. FG1]|nr:hypothetical protein [Pseudomonas sp. FG1]
MPNAMVSTVGDQPLGRYNGAPSNQFALFHQGGDVLNADMVRWGSKLHWAKDRTPVNARVEKVAHGPYYK